MSKIQFRNAAHRDFVLENLDKCKVNDCYHRAFFYVMGISEETRMNIGKMFDFKRDCIIPEGMHGGWQTSGTVKVCHLAFNLWNGFTEEGRENLYTPEELFCCGYAPYFMEGIKLRYPEYCRDFSYKGLSMDEIIHHLAVFVSRLWQIHIFGEGNTRTTAVFFIKYLGTLGFSVTNDIFAENAWYFRNALVRANYTNLQKGIHETTEYLEAFLRNLLLNEKNELHNRNLHISGLLNEEKVDIGDSKVDIENEKVDIQETKVDIESVLSEKGSDFSVKTTVHIHRLFKKFGFDEVFGRSAVMELLELKGSGASKLLSNLVQADIIEPVSGHGKGKYKFKM